MKKTDSKMKVDNWPHGKIWKTWRNDCRQIHRLEGPAMILPDNTKIWYVKGRVYCSSSQPAKEFIFGMLAWCEEVEKELKLIEKVNS